MGCVAINITHVLRSLVQMEEYVRMYPQDHSHVIVLKVRDTSHFKSRIIHRFLLTFINATSFAQLLCGFFTI